MLQRICRIRFSNRSKLLMFGTAGRLDKAWKQGAIFGVDGFVLKRRASAYAQ